MKVIGLAGWSGAGKTTLLTRLIPHLRAQGLSVSTVKHAHHDFDVDVPGKDSWRHREAGATEVRVSSANRFALMHELRGAPEPDLPELLARMARVDLVIVEGFKRAPHRKMLRLRARDAARLQGRLQATGEDPFRESGHLEEEHVRGVGELPWG